MATFQTDAPEAAYGAESNAQSPPISRASSWASELSDGFVSISLSPCSSCNPSDDEDNAETEIGEAIDAHFTSVGRDPWITLVEIRSIRFAHILSHDETVRAVVRALNSHLYSHPEDNVEDERLVYLLKHVGAARAKNTIAKLSNAHPVLSAAALQI